MSTQPISSSTSTSSNQFATGSSLSSLSGSSGLQITGLASGLDTNAVVQALMAAQQQQVTNLQNQQAGITALNKQLTSTQTALQTVADDAQALASPTLWANTQTITSTNSTLVGAAATSSNGAVVGSYSLTVSKLASASQKTFSFATQSSGNTITIDGHDTILAAGATAQDFVNAINNDKNATVYATVLGADPNQAGNSLVVLSNRQTGQPAGSYIGVTNSALQFVNGSNVDGTDAEYTINGGATQYSSSNTITGVSLGGSTPPTQGQGATKTIPGVTVSLNGVTGSTPVTVTVGAPAPSTQNIQTAVQKFITDYNSAISQIQTQLSQRPSTSDPTQGTLYGDPALQTLLSSMRQRMASTISGLPDAMNSMLDAGISTGASTGSGAISQSALAGNLTLDATKLTNALSNNASGLKSMMQSWSIKFSSLVDLQAGPGGTMSLRVQSDTSRSSVLANQIQNLTQANQLKQSQLVREFAQMEAALSQNQSTSSWLTSQLNSLSTH